LKLQKKENAAAAAAVAEDAKIEEVVEEGLKAEEEKTEEVIDAEAAEITTKIKVENLTALIEVTEQVLTSPIEVPALEDAEVNHFQKHSKKSLCAFFTQGDFLQKEKAACLTKF
jgi:hypothetical protein